jgi:hypothetical protein
MNDMRTEAEKERRRQYRKLPHVREAERLSRRERRAKNREHERELARARYQKNIEKERQRSREKNAQHPEWQQAASKKYRTVHADKVRAYQQKYYQEFREALDQYKLEHGCCDCGYNGHPAALDFDHVNGSKAKEVSLCGSIASALEEAKKCEIRCANCHRIKTFERRKMSSIE